jgi:hydrogenase maturation protease
MRILVAGIGNIFLGDDRFGVEVVQRLRDQPPGGDVDVVDFGIRGVHLAYEIAGGRYDAVVLVDAVPRGGAPGTLYAIEPDAGGAAAAADVDAAVVADAHGLTPDAVLAWVRRVGGYAGRVVVVGCEPATIEESMELSPAVAASVDGAVRMIRDLVARLSSGDADRDRAGALTSAGTAPCA